MTSPTHYPSPGDQYVTMPIRPGQTELSDEDIAGAHAFAKAGGLRIVRLLGVQRDREEMPDCLVWLAAPIEGYADTLHGVLEAIESISR